MADNPSSLLKNPYLVSLNRDAHVHAARLWCTGMENAEMEENEAVDEQELREVFYLLQDWLARHHEQDAMLNLLQAAEQMQDDDSSQSNTPRKHTDDAH